MHIPITLLSFRFEAVTWWKNEIKINNTIRKEGNVLFNDTLNTFYLQLYGIRYMVMDHSDSERKPTAATWATLFD